KRATAGSAASATPASRGAAASPPLQATSAPAISAISPQRPRLVGARTTAPYPIAHAREMPRTWGRRQHLRRAVCNLVFAVATATCANPASCDRGRGGTPVAACAAHASLRLLRERPGGPRVRVARRRRAGSRPGPSGRLRLSLRAAL